MEVRGRVLFDQYATSLIIFGTCSTNIEERESVLEDSPCHRFMPKTPSTHPLQGR